MSKDTDDDNKELPIPPQIRVAFGVLYHARQTTDQIDASIPARELTQLEKSVCATALRTIQHYMLGEMDYAAVAPASSTQPADANNATGTSVSSSD